MNLFTFRVGVDVTALKKNLLLDKKLKDFFWKKYYENKKNPKHFPTSFESNSGVITLPNTLLSEKVVLKIKFS